MINSTGNPAIDHVTKFFAFSHLPEGKARNTSSIFCGLADSYLNLVDGKFNPETTVALRKLLEAKDAAVRSVIG